VLDQSDIELAVSPVLKTMDASIFADSSFGLKLKEARHV
jgi:propionate CoA-transferase